MPRPPLPTDVRPTLEPVLRLVAELDLSDPAAARARLEAELPLDSPAVRAIRAMVERGLAEGWLCPRQNGDIQYGRVFKASEDTHGLGVDAVHMSSPGPGHLHPSGEVDLCFALDGSPTFDGNPPGWTVYADGSWHVPTVTGGTMAILYFLPDGAIHFGPRPD